MEPEHGQGQDRWLDQSLFQELHHAISSSSSTHLAVPDVAAEVKGAAARAAQQRL